MDYNDVALFAHVIEAGSFTAAAAALGLPKSSVSRGVSRLEESLGVRLLHRTTRSLGLTDAGQSFYERARGAIAGLSEAASTVRELGGEPRGLVRLTAPGDAHAMGLAEAIARFVKRHPAIQVELSLTSRVVDLVAEGFDLAIRAGRLSDSTLVTRRIGSSDLLLFAAPAYLRRRGRPRALADLARHDCILFRARGNRATWHLTGPEGEVSVEVRGPVSADDMPFIARATIAGLGISLLPIPLARAAVEQQTLELVLPDHRFTGASLQVVLPSSAFVPSRVALLRDFLAEHLAKELDDLRQECTRHGARR